MVDSNNRNRAEENDLAQDDPFAELTRIMGHDPRSARTQGPVAAEPEDGLALDLESELMGRTDGDDIAGEPGGVQSQAEPAMRQPDLADPQPAPDEPEFESTLEALLDESFAEDAVQPGQFASLGEPAQAEEPEGEPFAPHEPDMAALEGDLAALEHDTAPGASQDEPEPYEPAAEAPFDYAKAAAARLDLGAADERELAAGQTAEAGPAQPLHEADFAAAGEPAYGDAYDDFAHDQSQRAAEAAPMQPRYANTAPPEVDTVEVPEGTVAVADNLDVPDVSYREGLKPADELQEIEDILAGAFGETGDSPGDSWAETTPFSEPVQSVEAAPEDDDFAASIAAAGLGAAGAAGATAYAGRDEHEYWAMPDEDVAQLMPEPGTEPPVKPRRWRPDGPALMVAGVLAGVLLLGGGATLLAFSFGGGDVEPAVVAADDSPVKVRPENPGGTQIPNQDNQVYKRVSGEEATDARPAQAELITTTEEPVELTPLPGVQEASLRLPSGSSSPAAEGAEGAPVGNEETLKFEERLTNTDAEERSDEEDITALSPRRVRSFVVREDGSMVPNEPPPPPPAAPAAEAPSEVPQAAAGTATAQTPDAQPVDVEPDISTGATAAPAENAATVSVPLQGPIPPSRPAAAARQQSAQPEESNTAQAPPQPAQQQVAAVASQPAQAATAPSSEWSVQIASQPSAEAAQQTYQQLAQRYGSMLEGRGVNIVKADIEGKGTYYRVRIPSASKDEAIQLCSQLKSAGGSCFVSK